VASLPVISISSSMGRVQDGADLAHRAEEVQREVEPVHAGVGQQTAASQVGGDPPALEPGPQAQAEPDEHRPAEGAAVDESFGLGVRGVEHLVVGHAESHARGGRGVDELLAVREAGRQRFLDQDVPAGPDRFHGHGEVQVVGQADAHRADLGVGDQLTGVPVAAHAPGFEGRSQLRYGIGHGDQARDARPPDCRGMDLADLAQANEPDGAGSGGAAGTHGRQLARDRGDRFDFDQLVAVAEHGNAQECARRVMIAEGGLDDLPGGDEIGLLGRGHEDGGLEHVGQRGAEVGHGQAGLGPDVADAHDLAVIVQRASPGGEDQRTGRGGGRIRVRHPGVQAVTANQIDRH